jgi:trk system potassium uptake protein TrkH
MAIGGGPCSTAGGVKVTTVMVLAARAWSTFKGRTRVDVFQRHLPEDVVDRATAASMVFFLVAIFALTWLLAFEQSNIPHLHSDRRFLDAMFEVISALGTVGLSTGLTPELSWGGRWIVILLMFVGRLGSIPIFTALARPEHDLPYERPVETPLIG